MEGLRKWFIAPLLQATSLREVDLSFGFEYSVRQTQSLDLRMKHKVFRNEFPFWLKNCNALSKLSVRFFTTDGFGNDMRREPFEGVVKRITEKAGIEGRFEEDAWVWEARDGRFMDWSQVNIGPVQPKQAKEAVYLDWLDLRADSSYKQCVADAELKSCRRGATPNLGHLPVYGHQDWEVREACKRLRGASCRCKELRMVVTNQFHCGTKVREIFFLNNNST